MTRIVRLTRENACSRQLRFERVFPQECHVSRPYREVRLRLPPTFRPPRVSRLEDRRARALEPFADVGRRSFLCLRSKNLCAEKFGVRFQQDKAFRHQIFDALIAAVENIGR
jgi:hypothetical protein